MKSIKFCEVLLFILMMCVTANVFALELYDKNINITVTDSFVSRYIWRGQDLYSDNDGAHQPSIDISSEELFFGNDVSLNVWGSFPAHSGHEDAEELDYTLSFSREVFDGLLSVSEGYTYFDYPNTGKTADVSEPWMSVTFDKIPKFPIDVAFNIFAAYDFQAASGGPDEGWYYSWGLSTDLGLPKCAITQDGQMLSLGITNWGNDGPADLKPSALYATDFSVSTSYAFDNFTISPSLNYTANYEDEINNGDDEFWGGIEISYAF